MMIPTGFLNAMMAELLLCGGAMILLLLGAYATQQSVQRSLIGLSMLLLVVVLTVLYGNYTTISDPLVFMEAYRTDSFTVFVKLIIVAGAFLSLMLSARWINEINNGRAEYPVLLLFATLGLMLLVSADSLLSFYIALELASLTMYVMAAYNRDHLQSSEAGLKYFVLGALASGMLLFGISLIYGFGGSIVFEELSLTLAEEQVNIGVITGLVLVLVAVCFKVSAVPFHMWTPDVYEGAPTPVVAFFATAPKVAVICLLVRLLNQVFGENVEYWQQVILFAAVGSMVLGALAGLVQTNIKRLIAYSSIGHIGYILLGVAAASASATQSLLIYLVIYILMSFGLFACILLLYKGGRPIVAIDDLAGLSSSHPKMALALAVLMFSMAGIPPFAGFFAKVFIFSSALESGLTWAVIIAVLASVVACFYYIRIVKVMYFDEQSERPDSVPRGSLSGYVLMASLAINVFVVAPALLTEPAKLAASALFP